MTITTIAPYLALVLTALSISNIIWTWLRTRDQGNAAEKAAVAQRITDIGGRVDRHENRIQSVEQTLRTLPAKDDMHELQLAMERLRGDMSRMSATMEGHVGIMTRLENIVGRHEQHLLETSKR